MNSYLWWLLMFGSLYASPEKDFIQSFVAYYDCSQEGRYTHEYHPFLLQETKKSFVAFEQFLKQEGFSCPYRCIIMGYQQEGIPSFLSTLHDYPLNDEYVQRSKKGCSIPAHNIFGFLTGFLLKDSNWMQEQWFGKGEHAVYHHRSDTIRLFNDYSYVFQKTAFGKDIDYIFSCRNAVEKALKKQDHHQLLTELCSFWDYAYKGELKSFSHQILATQDIFFSIEYARHLLVSTIPVRTLYTGPDITYPIEILSCQQQQMTQSAQEFVQYFSTKMIPIEGKKTAYIFCSFVDGVGKSTLLGNVVNWKKYGACFERYTHVDNSSSQKPALYTLDDNVVILDLPAQLSHFVSKPDGYVFVPFDVAGCDGRLPEVQDIIKKNAAYYTNSYHNALQENHTCCPSLYEQYVSVAQIDNESAWVPFEYNSNTYLFKKDDLMTVLVAVPLDGVQSRGLKIAHPTHMLFTKGLSLPMKFEIFMHQCSAMLREAGVETVIFVDFLSMYPRSCRENIRVNFILQELKKIYRQDFDYEQSLYKTFTHGNLELYYDLQYQLPHFTSSLMLETTLRTALFKITRAHTTDDVCVLNQQQVTTLLCEVCQSVSAEHQALLTDLCKKKMLAERKALSSLTYDRTYQKVVNFSWQAVHAFSCFMNQLWTQIVYHPQLSAWWIHMGLPSKTDTVMHIFAENKDPLVVGKACSYLRAAWYVSLINLLHARTNEQGMLVLDRWDCPVVPCMLVKNGIDFDLKQYGTEPSVTYAQKTFLSPFIRYGIPVDSTIEAWAYIGTSMVMQPYKDICTCYGLFGLGYDWAKVPMLYNFIEQQMMNDHSIVYAVQVVDRLDLLSAWSSMVPSSDGKKWVIKKDSPYRQPIALMVRALATLEMVAKDPQAVMIVRRGVYEDFRAAVLLIEKIMLPNICAVSIEGDLFENYDRLEPVISWQQIGSYP